MNLSIRNLQVSIEDKPILRGLNLEIKQGEIHALMGPNGSGKSTLAYALMGNEKYRINSGEILLDDENLLDLSVDERAHRGLFLAFQYPTTIPGVTLADFLRRSVSAVRRARDGASRTAETGDNQFPSGDPCADARVPARAAGQNEGPRHRTGVRPPLPERGFLRRGEKKRVEVLQMAMLQPTFAILDETDSGLDIDALRTVAEGVNALAGSELGVLVITHYQRLLNYIKPDFVHILLDGQIVESGGAEMAEKLEASGYDWLREKYTEPAA